MKRSLCILLLFSCVLAGAQQLVLDNGVIRREISIHDGHISGQKYRINSSSADFMRPASREFSFMVDGVPYSGESSWKAFRHSETQSKDGGKGIVLSFEDIKNRFRVTLTYLSYPDLPIVRKFLSIENIDRKDICLEAVNVEDFAMTLSPIESWVMRQYARYKWLGPYEGNWDDPLIIVQDNKKGAGIAIGNEAVGVLKRSSVFLDGMSLTAGMTTPSQDFPFRRWLKKGEKWESPGCFTALYEGAGNPYEIAQTVVQDFVRRHMGVRIEQIPRKPMFVYNTWNPFRRNIDEKLIRELAEAAAECGVEEFVIDDGWQLNVNSPADKPEYLGDWEVDSKKFPGGLKPVFDHIKSLGMRPGLWISLATADPSSIVLRDHPEWFVKGADGQLTDLHNQRARSRTGCMGTDWYDYIKEKILYLEREYGLAYVKLDLSILSSAYVFDRERVGCHAHDHALHRDWAESFDVIYSRCMQLFDELHRDAPDLFIDCTFETAGKMQLMDYGIALHAEGNWLSNITQPVPVGSLRMRDLAWGRSPVLPPASLVIGNLKMDEQRHELNLKSLSGALPIMLGDPRQLTSEQRQRYRQWADWLKGLERTHGYMSFRQDLPGFGEPAEGSWDGFCRINSETGSGGLVGVFNQGSMEKSRTVFVPYLLPDRMYQVRRGPSGEVVANASGKALAEEGFDVTLTAPYDGELFEVVLQ